MRAVSQAFICLYALLDSENPRARGSSPFLATTRTAGRMYKSVRPFLIYGRRATFVQQTCNMKLHSATFGERRTLRTALGNGTATTRTFEPPTTTETKKPGAGFPVPGCCAVLVLSRYHEIENDAPSGTPSDSAPPVPRPNKEPSRPSAKSSQALCASDRSVPTPSDE